MAKLIGIFGGTFNPVHLGHLHIARELLRLLPFDEIRFLPCHTPVHRNSPSCTPEDRLNMLKLALENLDKTTIDTHEIDRQGDSYMIDTLRALKAENPNDTFVLIVGSDAFASLNTWKEWQSLTDYCHLLVVNRPGYQAHIGQVAEYVKPMLCRSSDEFQSHDHGRVMHIAVKPSPISGSELRHAKKLGKSLANFVPPNVYGYIKEHKLYL